MLTVGNLTRRTSGSKYCEYPKRVGPLLWVLADSKPYSLSPTTLYLSVAKAMGLPPAGLKLKGFLLS